MHVIYGFDTDRNTETGQWTGVYDEATAKARGILAGYDRVNLGALVKAIEETHRSTAVKVRWVGTARANGGTGRKLRKVKFTPGTPEEVVMTIVPATEDKYTWA